MLEMGTEAGQAGPWLSRSLQRSYGTSKPQPARGGFRYGKIWGRAFWDVDMCTGPEAGTGFIALREENKSSRANLHEGRCQELHTQVHLQGKGHLKGLVN